MGGVAAGRAGVLWGGAGAPGAVGVAEASEAAEDASNVGPEGPAVGVHLVQDHVGAAASTHPPPKMEGMGG